MEIIKSSSVCVKKIKINAKFRIFFVKKFLKNDPKTELFWHKMGSVRGFTAGFWGSFLLYVSVVTLCVQSHFMCPALTLCVRSYFVNFSLYVSEWKLFVCAFYVSHQLFFSIFEKINALVATDCIFLQIFSKKNF